MAKADLRKAETDWRASIGHAIERTRTLCGLTLKEFTAALPTINGKPRDERQIARWIRGEERPQLDAIFAVEAFREPLVIALATLTDTIEIETVLHTRRRA